MPLSSCTGGSCWICTMTIIILLESLLSLTPVWKITLHHKSVWSLTLEYCSLCLTLSSHSSTVWSRRQCFCWNKGNGWTCLIKPIQMCIQNSLHCAVLYACDFMHYHFSVSILQLLLQHCRLAFFKSICSLLSAIMVFTVLSLYQNTRLLNWPWFFLLLLSFIGHLPATCP